MAILDMPENTIPVIREVWAYVAVDESGNEGFCAYWRRTIGWTPLIAADSARLDKLRPIAVGLARKSGKRIRLVRFSTRELLETIDGGH